MATELGQQTVDFSALVRRAAEDSYLTLKDLVEKSSKNTVEDEKSDSEKKIDLLKFISKTQQRMLRLNVLAKWCKQIPLVNYCQQLASTLSSHDTCFTQTADSLFFMHEGLQQARAPIFDVPSATEILLTKGYKRLPKCIENLGMQTTLPDDQLKPALKKLNILLGSKLLEISLPKEISEVKVSDGTAKIRVRGEFEVYLTLGYRGHISMWRILHLKLLVGEKNGPLKLEESRRYALGDDLERRMSIAENPFIILYNILHEICTALVMDTVLRQVKVLRQGRWKDTIRFELISDGNSTAGQLVQDSDLDSAGQKTPGLKIFYWLDFEKTPAFIKIEPGNDLKIKCVHSSFIFDPLTGKEAEFFLDQSCIDIEKLLLRVISCHKHTRLLEIQRELSRNSQICQASGDVNLKCKGDGIDTDEVLCVRTYGTSYVTLGINVRNGRFLLQSNKSTLSPSSIAECEESLNSGSMTSVEVFIVLRSKSILQLFTSIGKSMGLTVYEQGLTTMKIPKSILRGSNFILMGFPQHGDSYYLLMQLDKEFRPLFSLLDSQPEPFPNSQTINETNRTVCLKKIDINRLQMIEDESNVALIDWQKLQSLQNIGASSSVTEYGIESSTQLSGPAQRSFSSIVSEIFESDKVSLVSTYSAQSHSSLFNASSLSHLKHGNNETKISSGSLSRSSYDGITNVSTFCSSPGNNLSIHKLPLSKSDQDLASLRSPRLDELGHFTAIDGDRARSLNSSPKDVGALFGSSRIQQPSSPLRTVDTTVLNIKSSEIRSPSNISAGGLSKGQTTEDLRKRPLYEIVEIVPSLQVLESYERSSKRLKISEPYPAREEPSSLLAGKASGYTYGSVLSEANLGLAPSNIYVSMFLQVIRHCSLCIKLSQLTSQMDALEIPYIEEVGRSPSSNLWFQLPFARHDSWKHICLRLGKPGNMHWDVQINDSHFKELWGLYTGNNNTVWGSGIRIANTSDSDSHIHCDPEGVVLSYKNVEPDSIKRLVSDLKRLANARLFACEMRKLIGARQELNQDDGNKKLDNKLQNPIKGVIETGNSKLSEQMRRTFRIEAVGLMSLWFSYGSTPVMAHFVVEWEAGKDCCTMHVSPDHLWPHTKFLEDFINGGDVASFLDCIRLTAGPLLALAAAIPPARMSSPTSSTTTSSIPKQSNFLPSQTPLPNVQSSSSTGNAVASSLSSAMRGAPGTVASSLLPIDVSIVLRSPYWIRIVYRKKFAVDMRCFAGDQVWLQPATPPKGGPTAGGSLPCPQFRPFIMEHVAQGLNALESNLSGAANNSSSSNQGPTTQSMIRTTVASSNGMVRPNAIVSSNLSRNNNPMPSAVSGLPGRVTQGTGVPVHIRGELNTAFIGLGDDGGYGGGWVPLAALKKVLRGILKYLGVLWLFAQLPDLLKEILGSILKDNEGALLNLDQEQPALRFFVGSYVFAVSVHRVQLLLQVLSVKKFQPQQQQQQQSQTNAQEELTQSEITEISEYFSRRVASEPYDASRVASFITLLTLPIHVLRDFLKLIAWKKSIAQSHSGDVTAAQRARIEISLENHSGTQEHSKSNIHYDRANHSVEFALTFVLDHAHIPHVNAAGGAAWLPYCVSIRLKYSFGEGPNSNNNNVSFVEMGGSHGGRACWSKAEDWERCKQRVMRTLEYGTGNFANDAAAQGRLKSIAESLQRALQIALQQLRDGVISSAPVGS